MRKTKPHLLLAEGWSIFTFPDALGTWHHNHNTVTQYTFYIYYIYNYYNYIIIITLCISTLGLQRHGTTDHSLAAKLLCAIIHAVHASNLPIETVLGDLNKS